MAMGGRDWSQDATSLGVLGATRTWKKQKDAPLKVSEGAWPCQYLGVGLLAFRTETIHFLVSNCPVCAYFSQQSQKTNT